MRATTVLKASTIPKEMTFAEKHAKRMKRLRSLQATRNEARTLNHQEVVAEEARYKLPSNYEVKRHQAEWLLDDQAKREEAEQSDKYYDGVKLLNISSTEVERLEGKKNKRNTYEGFSTKYQLTMRQYNILPKNMPAPEHTEHNEKQKQEYGDAVCGGPNVIIHGIHSDHEQVTDRMVDESHDLEGQIAKRVKYSIRRQHDDDEDIAYINYLLKVGIKI